ncbi:MAG TPA: IS1595 family transposase [Stellaceae bacterium]|nr:IS1595 family transposase [Stellaceae bacterium]
MANPVLSAEHFHNEEAAYEYVEARLWPNGPHCPHCGNADTAKIGRLANGRPGLRKCYTCRKQFTVKVGTIFEDSHLPMQLWLQAIHLLAASKKGFSTAQLRRTLGCGMKTAWFLTHRIREMMADTSGPMGGGGSTIEIDETYVGGKAHNRHLGQRGGGAGRERLKAPVFALVERGGKARAVHVPWVTGENLTKALEMNAKAGTTIYSDENHTTRFAARGFKSDSVNHKDGEYVRGDVYTNTVEGFFAIVKRGLTGVYHSVSDEHLDRYLAEFSFRYSNRSALGVEDVQRAEIALAGAVGKRLTYETTRSAKGARPVAS